jgi:hypothetical protein
MPVIGIRPVRSEVKNGQFEIRNPKFEIDLMPGHRFAHTNFEARTAPKVGTMTVAADSI